MAYDIVKRLQEQNDADVLLKFADAVSLAAKRPAKAFLISLAGYPHNYKRKSRDKTAMLELKMIQ